MDSDLFTLMHLYRGRRVIMIMFLAAAMLIGSACTTYKHQDGSRERILNPRKDGYRKLDKQEYARLSEFDPDHIGRPYSMFSKDLWDFEEVGMKELQQVLDNEQKTLLVMWYPNCGSILPQLINVVRQARELEREDLQIVLLSMSYSLDEMRENQHNYFRHFEQSYVLKREYGKYLITRAYEFVNEFCSHCFDRYGQRIDDLYLFLYDRDAGIIYDGLLVWNEEEGHNDLYRKDLMWNMLQVEQGAPKNPLE